MVTRFLIGASYLVKGLSMLGNPGIRRYVWLPVLMNMALLMLVGIGISRWFESWGGFESDWLGWASWLVMPLLLLLMVLVFGYFFSALLVAIASPFYGLLAGRIERQEGVLSPDENLGHLVLRTFAREWQKIRYFMPRYILLLLLTLIPVLNLAMPFIWFWFGSWIMALQYRDYTLDNQGINFPDSRRILEQDRWGSLGFGGLVSVLMMIPVVNCFVPPAAVIGATLWHLDSLNPDGESRRFSS